jgi:hypothetical protein
MISVVNNISPADAVDFAKRSYSSLVATDASNNIYQAPGTANPTRLPSAIDATAGVGAEGENCVSSI